MRLEQRENTGSHLSKGGRILQISRLFEIVYLLLMREQLSAAELARHFEVSTRTIYRDIDTLSGAGIPVYAARGKGGGIRLLPGFVMDRSWFTEGEQGEILAAVQSLAAAKLPEADRALHKLAGLFQTDTPPWVTVDFSDWSSGSFRRMEAVKTAILQRRVLSFSYYNASNQRTERKAEPRQLCFKHRAWYVTAWCLHKNAPRLFKLNRMREVRLTDQPATHLWNEPSSFLPPEPAGCLSPLRIVLRFQPSAAYRVYDDFEDEQITPHPDGGFTVETDLIEDNWLLGYLLSFGPQVRVEAPARIRERVAETLGEMLRQYRNT